MADISACMGFSDAGAQIAFLERAFGFVPETVVREEDRIAHAELRLGNDFIMIHDRAEGLDATNPWPYRTPRELGEKSTGMLYIGLADVDAAFERARAAGAEVVRPLAATDYDSREFAVRDPEGFHWSFGTYHPTAEGEADPSAPPSVYPGLRYVRAREAIAWLVSAFGFEEQCVYGGEGDTVAHAQLRFGDDIVMLGSTRGDERDTLTPAQAGDVYTHSYWLHVADPDAHHARAVAAGAQILSPPTDKPYGSRDYVARDPEGYVWSFGTYRPVANAAPTAVTFT